MNLFFKKIARWIRLFPDIVFTDKVHRNKIRRVMHDHDMVAYPSENYFGDRYMHIFDSVLKNERMSYKDLKIMDAGCGHGRLSIMFAKRGGRVDALDTFSELLEKAKMYAQKENIPSNHIRWVHGELPGSLDSFSDRSYDLVVCTEVLFMMAGPEETIRRLARLLRPGGILVISHRTRLFYLLCSLINRDFFSFKKAAECNSYKDVGRILSWSDPKEMEDIFFKEGLKNIRKWGIGMLSGIEGDPTAKFCLPHELNTIDRQLLGQVEDQIADVYPDAGRYIVYSGVKHE